MLTVAGCIRMQDPDALGDLAEFQWVTLRDLDGAEQTLRQCLASNPRDIPAMTELAEFLTEARSHVLSANPVTCRQRVGWCSSLNATLPLSGVYTSTCAHPKKSRAAYLHLCFSHGLTTLESS